jgi:hypothetical protein
MNAFLHCSLLAVPLAGLLCAGPAPLRAETIHIPAPAGPAEDATHFTQCAGRILVEDCRFENMLDDGLNMHGVHAAVDSLLAPDRIGARLIHFQRQGIDYVAPGKCVRLASRATLRPYAGRVVRECRRVNAGCFELVFTQPVAGVLRPGSIIENASASPTSFSAAMSCAITAPAPSWARAAGACSLKATASSTPAPPSGATIRRESEAA